ncbi:MAG: nucleoside deaminase [Alphaproteobacteria bacterium]|nr:nucleoside deaminase [Alphaproteobacteria bacterium]
MTTDEEYMLLALKEARLAAKEDEVPIGAVIVSSTGEILATAHNSGEHGIHAMAHAEVQAMSLAAIQTEQKRLWDCTLYVTIEPCAMCAAAISLMRIKRVVFGAENKKGGAVINGVRYFENHTCNHKPQITSGVLSDHCGDLLSAFFQSKRQ